MKKKLLFVVETLGRAGVETALLELVRKLDPEQFEISLFVLRAQGDMASALPPYVQLLNTDYDTASVHSRAGRWKLRLRTLPFLWRHGTAIRLIPYAFCNLWDMFKRGSIHPERLLWRLLSEGAPRLDTEFDLAVAYMDGSSTYYVADHVKAVRKVAFVHTDYTLAGYTRALDQDCYSKMDRIFAISDEVRSRFL